MIRSMKDRICVTKRKLIKEKLRAMANFPMLSSFVDRDPRGLDT